MSSCEELEIFDSAFDAVEALLKDTDFIRDEERVKAMAQTLKAFVVERIMSLDDDLKYIGGETRLQHYERNFSYRYKRLGFQSTNSDAYDLTVCFSLSMGAFKYDDFINPALVESFEWELLKSAFG